MNSIPEDQDPTLIKISKENKGPTINLNFSVSVTQKRLFSSQKSYFRNTSFSSVLSDPFSVGGDIMITTIFKDLESKNFFIVMFWLSVVK